MKEIITVRGAVPAASCGRVLPHEHLFIDLTNQAAPGASERPVTPGDRAALLCDPYAVKDNLLIENTLTAAGEMQLLLEAGCDTVVDCSLKEIGRDPLKLKALSEKTGSHIVMGCGWYTGDTHPADLAALPAEHWSELLLDEVLHGADGTAVRPGIIGEIGTSKEILPGEWKALEAASAVQKKTGLALMIHIYPWCTNGIEVTDFLTARGVAPDRIVICHSDVAPDHSYIQKLLQRGVWVELDNFGKEFTPAPGGFAAGSFAKDSERAALAARIIREGYSSQLLLTNDICLKCMLRACGGEGYVHIFNNILPLIEAEGISMECLSEQIMRTNPLAMLTGEKF